MPIYAYKCSSCGHTQDVLQKLSAQPLTDCPACGSATYAKQVTAPQFQLKGSGWYVTDFRGGGEKDKKDTKDSKADGKSESATADAKTGAAADAKSDSKGNGTKEAPAATSAPSAPAAAPAPAKPATANDK